MTYAIPGAWAEHGACVGATARMEMPDASPTGTRGPAQRARHHIDAARTIYATCPVLEQCRTWALTDPDPADYMIAGGLTPRERDTCRRAGETYLTHTHGTGRDEPPRCRTCGYSLDGAHHLRRYCSDACNPQRHPYPGDDRRWDHTAEQAAG